MLIEEALKDLGRQMGVPLQLDRNRACRLVFEERWTIDIEAPGEHRDLAFLYGVIGQLPPQADAGFFKTLLEANLFGRETFGATLAIDSARSEIIVQRIVAMDQIDFNGFAKVIEDLIRALAAWTERVATHDQKAPSLAVDSTFSASVIRA